MKTSIMKLSFFAMMAAMAMFTVVATASAGSTSINGHYALSGFTSCSFKLGEDSYSPADPGIMEADYTFNKDGTGSATGWVRQLPTPNYFYITLDFTYAVTKGRIEFAYPSGGFKAYLPDKETYLFQLDAAMSHGVISPDGKTMTISCGPPVSATVKESPMGPPVGTEAYCINTLVGMRVNNEKGD